MDKEVADEIMYSSIPDLVRAITKLHVKLDVLSETVKDLGDRLKLLERGQEIKHERMPYPANWTPEDVNRLEEMRARRKHMIMC